MALNNDLGKNGYQYTGYSEPFIVPEGITVTATGPISGKDMGVNGITGAVAIEYSSFKNAGLYVRSYITDTAVTEFTSKDLNIDTRMDDDFTTIGKWIISDDYEAGVTDLDASNNVTIDAITYDNVTKLYTVEVSGAIDVIAGQAFRVLGRVLDLGDAVSAGYTEGQHVSEIVTREA